MQLKKEALKKAADILRKHVISSTDLDLSICLSQMADASSGTVNLIDRNAYFATILWQEEDIRTELRDRALPDTDEVVDEVLNLINLKQMEDCSEGFECIYRAIDKWERLQANQSIKR